MPEVLPALLQIVNLYQPNAGRVVRASPDRRIIAGRKRDREGAFSRAEASEYSVSSRAQSRGPATSRATFNGVP